MNTTLRARRRLNRKDNSLIDNQSAAATEDETSEDTVTSEEGTYGPILTSTFSIKIKNEGDDAKEKPYLYENKKESYKYQAITNFPSLLKYLGAENFPDGNIDILGKALTSEDEAVNKEIGQAITDLLKIANAKFKSDAKASAYQGLVNKYAPLEGEKKMTAIARTINNFVKLAGITPEVAIEVLRSKGAVEADYTLQDYKDTKLRKAKESSEEDED